MADLVTQDSGQLGLVVEARQQAATGEDLSARQREGVDDVRVEHRELPRQVGVVRFGEPGHRPADPLDVTRDLRRLQLTAVLLDDLELRLLPESLRLLDRQQQELAAAGRGVDGAAGEPEQQYTGNDLHVAHDALLYLP